MVKIWVVMIGLFLIRLAGGILFARAVWKKNAAQALILGAANIALGAPLLGMFLMGPPELSIRQSVVGNPFSMLAVPAFTAAITQTLFAGFLIALRRRRKILILATGSFLAILALGAIGAGILTMNVMLFHGGEIPKVVALRDEMVYSHIAGETTTALIEKYGLPYMAETEEGFKWTFHPSLRKLKTFESSPGGRQRWLYYPDDHWYVIYMNNVVVIIEDGKVKTIGLDVF